MDKLTINGFNYFVTDSISDITINMAQRLNQFVPKNSWYRSLKEKDEIQDNWEEYIELITLCPIEVLEHCDNIEHIYSKFIHPLLISLYHPQDKDIKITEKDIKPFKLPVDIYQNESIHAFAEVSELLRHNNPIDVAELICAVYLRENGKQYNEKESLVNIDFFKAQSYDLFVTVLNAHVKASETIRELHPRVFQVDGNESKDMGMISLISMVAERGVFNRPELTPLQSVQQVKVSEFFDYVESII